MLNSLLGALNEGDDSTVICSRSRCSEQAVFIIEWRNPKIHTEDRVKKWSACGEHVEYLQEFLKLRNFPVNVVSIKE